MEKYLVVCLLLFQGVFAQSEAWGKFSKKNKDVLGLNAIVADKNYYSQAILEFLLVKQIIEKSGESMFDIPNNNPKAKWLYSKTVSNLQKDTLQKYGKHIIKLFDKKIYQNQTLTNAITDELGVAPCEIIVPKSIHDLKSGFQFRHYLFKGDNKTALQAFGIINNEIKKSDLYVVIDYLQFEDCNCTGLPKIRYAVGLRSEFKISGIELNKDNNENSLSIEKLAARVEFGQIKVDISMKTIGITGSKARLNIPVNTSFDVQTYGEYTKVIDFIRNSIDSKDSIYTQPELIPVMDEYRTSVSDINTAVFQELKIIQKKYKKEVEESSNPNKDTIIDSIQNIINKSLKEEITHKDKKRKNLYDIDEKVNNLKRYLAILEYTYAPNSFEEKVNTKIKDEQAQIEKGQNNIETLYSVGFDKLAEKKYDEALNKFKEVYNLKPTYANADEIIKAIEERNNKNISDDKLLEDIIKNYMWKAPSGAKDKLEKAKDKLEEDKN